MGETKKNVSRTTVEEDPSMRRESLHDNNTCCFVLLRKNRCYGNAGEGLAKSVIENAVARAVHMRTEEDR